MLLPARALYIFLLAQHRDASTAASRRCFLNSSITSSCASLLLLPPSAIAKEEDNDSVTILKNSYNNDDPLYLARPMGANNNNSNSKSRPSADIQYLVPATRVGVYIYQLLSIAEQLSQSNSNGINNKEEDLLQQFDTLLLSPPSFITPNDPTVTRSDPYNNLPPLIGEFTIQQQKQNERKQQQLSVGFAPQLFEVGNLIGERRQWSRLIRIEQSQENASEIRRALNIYTTNLNFNPNQYVYSGTTEEKKRLIREDRLPSVTEVIRSDLDARDLYRNEVQTKLEDVRAEYLYQVKMSGDGKEEMDWSELLGLLRDGKRALDEWFGFIPDEDVRLALEVVKNEQKSR